MGFNIQQYITSWTYSYTYVKEFLNVEANSDTYVSGNPFISLD